MPCTKEYWVYRKDSSAVLILDSGEISDRIAMDMPTAFMEHGVTGKLISYLNDSGERVHLSEKPGIPTDYTFIPFEAISRIDIKDSPAVT